MTIKPMKIVAVQASDPFILTISYEGGEHCVNIADHINSAQHVFGPLLCSPQRFFEVELDEYGSCVGWYFDGTDDMEIPGDILFALPSYQE